ncbi:Sugar phosphate isomerase/epimerase [Cohnella sp. OV330]|uniref:sugar phosphate isomerase/epimerase family protein n=1 Tax=Cohnella sp. OV330 TaxID=1855288 RepID=UPI0008EAE781|nr:sugar phosphate isomerase/epimerase family protein [Cohnella sp. OV330]SFB47851.1 Sugar phosphate isomerase/epimerase [Cohnella sp. OV330]
MNVYVSTSAIKEPFDLERVLNIYGDLGFKNIELGSSHTFRQDVREVITSLQNKYGFHYVVHNYFPPHETAFALNLSSLNESIRRKSIEHAKAAIDLSFAIQSPIYSIHPGMISDPKEIAFFTGFTFEEANNSETTYQKCFDKLVASCKELNEYAKQRGVKFAIENSGGHPAKYIYLMMTRHHEFERLMKEIDDPNFGILFDIGHYHLSTTLYETERMEDFILSFRNRIFQVHIHSNDGSDDQHLPPTTKECELLSIFNPKSIFVLEAMKNSPDQIANLVKLLQQTTMEVDE